LLGQSLDGDAQQRWIERNAVRVNSERLGFEVLVWESDIIDLERTEAGLRGDGDLVESAQCRIVKIWSASAGLCSLIRRRATTVRGR
jgi:hypothetical protein